MDPTPKSAHQDAALTAISIAHRNANFIADRVFPNVPVDKQSDKYYTFPKAAWFRKAGKRGPGARAGRSGYKVSSGDYRCEETAEGHPIPLELLNNADSPLDPMASGVRFATNAVMLAKEYDVSALVMNASNWTTDDDVDADWNHADASNTFISDIRDAKETLRRLIGRYPNRLLMDSKTFKEITQIADVLDRIKYTGTQGKPADVTAAVLAQLFELDEVLIGNALYNSAEETVAAAEWTAVDLWEVNATKGSALLYYAPTLPAIEEPAAGYTFNWKGAAGDMAEQLESDVYRSVRRYYEEAEKQWVVECSEYYDPKITSAAAGVLFHDTIVT